METVSFSRKYPQPRVVQLLTVLFWSFLIALTLVNIGLFHRTLSPHGLCRRDLHQDYLQALAVRDNLDPFLSLEELARRYSPDCENSFWPHASPHTLTQLLLTLPLSYLGEWWFSLTWLLMSFAAFVFALVRLRSRGTVFTSQRRFLAAFLILLTSQPVTEDLWFGQVNLLVLALLSESLSRLEKEQLGTAGALIGFSIALKPLAWLIVPYLLFRRPGAGIAALVSFGIFQLINTAFFGFDMLERYYREAARGALTWWFHTTGNVSVMSIFERVIRDRQLYLGPLASEPMAPSIPQSLSHYGLLVGLSGLSLVWALRSRTLESGWCRVFVLSPLLLPLTWVHYLVLHILVLGHLFEGANQLPVTHRGRLVAWIALCLWWLSASTLGSIAHEAEHSFDRWMALLQFMPSLIMLVALQLEQKSSTRLPACESERNYE